MGSESILLIYRGGDAPNKKGGDCLYSFFIPLEYLGATKNIFFNSLKCYRRNSADSEDRRFSWTTLSTK